MTDTITAIIETLQAAGEIHGERINDVTILGLDRGKCTFCHSEPAVEARIGRDCLKHFYEEKINANS